MPKIIVKRKGDVYKEFLIRPFQSRIMIGSDGDNDLIISDNKVALHHLIIEKQGTEYFVKNLDEASVCHLNGKKIVKKTQISNGDRISIGDHSLVFENALFQSVRNNLKPDQQEQKKQTESSVHDEPVKLPADDKNEIKAEEKKKNIKLTFAPAEQNHSSELSEIKPTETESVPHYLIAIYGPYTGKKYRINFGTTKIGRDKTLNDIVINQTLTGEVDTSISRRHATIFFEEGHYYIADKRSKTRTRVNRRELKEDDVIELYPNDEIEIVSDRASTIFRFVPEGKKNYARPRKSGDWWLRNGHLVKRAASILICFLLMLLTIHLIGRLLIISQKPAPLTFTESIFFNVVGENQLVKNPDEAIQQYQSLSPAATDLNGDGYLDLIFLNKSRYLNVIDGRSKENLWGILSQYRVQLGSGIVLTDLNRNNLADVIVPAQNSKIYALDGKTGIQIWESPILGGKFVGLPVVADFNGDKLADIFMCMGAGRVHVGYGTYNNVQWKSIETNSEITSQPVAGDIDGDGRPEVLVAVSGGRVLIYDDEERKFIKSININKELQQAKGSFYEDHHIIQRLTVGDLNQDQFDDMVVVTEKNHILAFDINQDQPIWFDAILTEPDSGALIPANLADVDDDQQPEVVVVTRDNKIIVYSGAGKGGGQKRIEWGYLPKNQETFVSPAVLADVNKDSKNDIILSDFKSGIKIFDCAQGEIIYQSQTASNDSLAVIGAPLVGDFNNDTWLDILVRQNCGRFSLMKSNSQVLPSSIFWGQVNFNSWQNGCQLFSGYRSWIYYVIIGLSMFIIFIIVILNIRTAIKRRRLFS